MGGAAGQALQLALLSLASFRLWRLAGRDGIGDGLRRRLDGRALEMVECPWCLGSWTAICVVAATSVVGHVRLPVLQAAAVAAVVGLLGDRVDVEEIETWVSDEDA